MYIPFFNLKRLHHSLKDSIQKTIIQVFNEGNFIQGWYRSQFEKRFAKLIGTQYCIGVGSGTEALFFALKALSLEPQDEVMTPAYSFIASASCISHANLTPVFIDCDKKTGNINPIDIIPKITSKTKAIIIVHLYGNPVNLDEIIKISTQYRLWIIEDCAQAHGAQINHQSIGKFGDIACFSFYPTKNLGACGNAGAILTSKKSIMNKLRLLVNHGRIHNQTYEHQIEGANSQLDEIQAAILYRKLDYFNLWQKKRQHIAQLYNQELAHYCDCPVPQKDTTHAYHLYVIQHKQRNKLKANLLEKGIETVIHYPTPLPFLSAYQHYHYQAQQFPHCWTLKDQVLSLPLHPYLLDQEIEHIIDTTKSIFKKI